MQPVPNWPNGLVCYTADDLRIRNFLIWEISERLRAAFKELNRSIDFRQVETPCLVPSSVVQDHLEDDFKVWQIADEELYLRPESTKGTFLMFPVVCPQEQSLAKRLPLCLWQVGLSFRAEQDKTFANLRFKQFYQLEFQLAYREGTKADYHECAVNSMLEILAHLFPQKSLRTEIPTPPFYSRKTTDIYLHEREAVAISDRTDFKYPILEISCGLDRLTAIYQNDV